MEILGIGPLELLLIVILMLVVMGPKDMVKTGQKLGRFVRQIIRSPAWSNMMNTTREIRELPTKFVRESGLEDDLVEINKLRDSLQFRDIPGKMIQEMSIQEDLARLKSEGRIDLSSTPVEADPEPSVPPSESPATEPPSDKSDPDSSITTAQGD
jgi:sec-independent protein translocase protein TatB